MPQQVIEVPYFDRGYFFGKPIGGTGSAYQMHQSISAKD
jgi:hypothetical protein